MNPAVRPPIEEATDTKFRNRVDSSSSMTIKKGRATPMTRRPNATAINLNGLSIAYSYLYSQHSTK